MTLFPTAAIILGLGTCQQSTDYCPDPIGKASIEVTTLQSDNKAHSIMFSAEHFSNVSDNKWLSGSPWEHGDRGTEMYFIQYKYQLNLR